jgi:hypothetical protein
VFSGLIVAVPLVDSSEMSVPNATSPAEVANGTRLTSRQPERISIS